MRRWCWMALCWWAFLWPAWALLDPPFTINRKITLAQVNRGGRVELEYDVSPYGAAGLRVTCFRFEGAKGTTEVQSWTLSQQRGKERLDFRQMPSSQYFFVGTLLNAEGKDLTAEFRPVQLEYGGWTGRLKVHQSTVAASRQPGSFSQIETQVQSEEASIFHVVPDAVVVAPGKDARLTAMLNERYMVEPLQWSLEGPGRLLVAENCFALYQAPKGARSGERATIRVYSLVHPNLNSQVQVLITTEPVSSPSAPQPAAPGSD